jgi:hypothetical protein
MPVLWGVSKDATGSYNFGLTLVPLVFVAAGAVGLHLRHQVRRNHGIVAAAAVAA